MSDDVQALRARATGQLLTELLTTHKRYKLAWRQRYDRRHGDEINQSAVALVLVDYQIEEGFLRAEDRDRASRKLKNTISRALNGASISSRTLEAFIAAFNMDEKDRQQLWATFNGEAAPTTVTVVESFNPNTHESKLWTPQPRKLNDPQPNYNFVSRESEIHYYVNQDGLMYKGERSRVLQAVEDGFQFYYFNVAESRDSLTLKKIRLGVEPPAEISNVTQFSTNGYSWKIKLPKALEQGETYHLRFVKEIEAAGSCDPWVIARTRNGQPPKMSVTFHPKHHPPYVWWFAGLISTASPGFFDEERRLNPNPTNQYTKDFTGIQGNGRVGIAWGW